jgi:hypothetical protein
MKFNYSILLFISAILAQSQSHENSEDKECYTKFECKVKDITDKMATDTKNMRCAEFIDDRTAMVRCIYKVAGLRDDQINLLFNIMSTSSNCGSGSSSQFKECINNCASDKSCKETCADNRTEENIQCLADQFDVKDFDVKKSVQCSKQCDQDTISEIMDCDMKCKEPLYKKISSDDDEEDSMSESDKDSKNSTTSVTTTKSGSKNPEPTGSSNTTSTNSSSTRSTSGVSSLSTGLFSAISIPILLSLIFIA